MVDNFRDERSALAPTAAKDLMKVRRAKSTMYCGVESTQKNTHDQGVPARKNKNGTRGEVVSEANNFYLFGSIARTGKNKVKI
jgi:hypothetical protein